MSWEEVYQRQFSRVYRICLLSLKNKEDAEDASQNVFIKYIEKQPTLDNFEHEKAWFIKVSRNQCKDYFKLFWNRNRRELIGDFPASNSGEKATQIDLIKELINMPNKFGITLYLYYYEDYSVKEISKLINVKESTIQSRLYHGRKRLKNVLGEDYNEE